MFRVDKWRFIHCAMAGSARIVWESLAHPNLVQLYTRTYFSSWLVYTHWDKPAPHRAHFGDR